MLKADSALPSISAEIAILPTSRIFSTVSPAVSASPRISESFALTLSNEIFA